MRIPFEKVLRQPATAEGGTPADPVTRPAAGHGSRWLDDVLREREAAGDRITFRLGLAIAVASAAFAFHVVQTTVADRQLQAGHPQEARAAELRNPDGDRDPVATGAIRGGSGDERDGSRPPRTPASRILAK